MFDDVITLFCRFGAVRAETFARAVVRGVRCTGALGEAAGVPQSKSRDRAVLLIPLSAAVGYVEPGVWRVLDLAQRLGKWTLQPGDIFMLGEVFLPEGGVQDAGAAVSQAMQAQDGFVITTVTRHCVRGPLAHFAVGAGSIYQHGGGLT